MILRDIEYTLKFKVKTDPAIALLEAYKKLLKVFSHKEANKLLSYCSRVDYTIYMQPGTQPPAGPHYSISRNGLQVLRKYLEDNLSMEFIKVLLSLAIIPVHFVKKPRSAQ